MMASKKTLKQLTGKKYFEKVKEKMIGNGFEFIAMVQISTEEGKDYYIPVTIGRITSLFFRLKEKSLIVKMTLCEDDYYVSEEVRVNWYINLYIQHKEDEAPGRMTDKDDSADYLSRYDLKDFKCFPEDYSELLGHCPHIIHGFEQRVISNKRMRVGVLIKNILGWISEINPFLGKNFKELWVVNFPPAVAFPGSDEIFWERFGLDKVKRLVKKQ